MIKSSTSTAIRPVTDLERPGLFRRILGLTVADECCLLWVGATCDGNPVISHRGRSCSVRRLMYEAMTGRRVPLGMVAAARCRQTACVSPDCLMMTTVAELRRLDAARGIFCHVPCDIKRLRASRAHATYSDELVQQARDFEGTCAQAAAATGISLAHVKRLRAGLARVSVPGVWRGLQ